MRLLGKYTFDRLRDAFQGVFEFYKTNDNYIIELWQLRFYIEPHKAVTIYLNGGEQKGYIDIGKFTLS